MDETTVVRSYQRIFRPDRRIYQIEGRSLPIPGGVPLSWLGWASAALLAAIVLSSGSPTVLVLGALAGGLAGLLVGGWVSAGVAAASAAVGLSVAGLVLGAVDWPLRLVVLPALVATLATQATPDGRRADRYARSWIALRLSPSRRTLGRACPLVERARCGSGDLWVAPDERDPVLRRGWLVGPATVGFRDPVALVRRRGLCPVVRPGRGCCRGGEMVVGGLVLADGERVGVRP